MTFPPPTQQNNSSLPTTTPRTLAFDLRCVADLLQRDANPSDVIDQAIIVSIPDDDRDVDTSLF